MAGTAKWYGAGFIKAFNKEVDWDTDTIKMMICTSSYVPNQDTHDYKNDVTNEVTPAGAYSAGGVTLTGKTVTYDTATNSAQFKAADVSIAGGAPTGRILVVYVSTGTDSTSALLGYMDMGSDFAVASVAWDSTGVLVVSAT